MVCDITQYEFVYRRASYEVWKRFGINKFELRMLLSFSWFLEHRNQIIVSKDIFFDTMTGNSREKRKMEGYCAGLVNRGFVGSYEYISSPGSKSIGISELGANTIRAFFEALIRFQEKFPRSPYRLDSSIPTVIDDPAPKYTKRSA